MSVNTNFHSNTTFLAKTVLSSDAIAQAEANSLFKESLTGPLAPQDKALRTFIENLNRDVVANPELAKPLNGFEKWVYVHHKSTGLLAKIARVALSVLPNLKEKITNFYGVVVGTIDKKPLIYTFLNEREKKNSHAALEVITVAALEVITVNPESIRDIGKELAKEEQFMLDALEVNPACYVYMTEQWKNNPRVTLKAISLNAVRLDMMGESLKNLAFYAQAIEDTPDFYFQLDEDTQRKPSVALKVLNRFPERFQEVLDKFENGDPKLRALDENERWSSEELDVPVSRQEMFDLAVLNCPVCWPHVSDIMNLINVLDVLNVLKDRIIDDPRRVRFLPDELMNDEAFMKELLEACPVCYSYLPETLRDRGDYATIVLSACPEMVKYLGPGCMTERSLTFAMNLNPDCYPYLNEEWRNNRVVSEKAISRKNELVAHLGSDLQTDVDYILDLVYGCPNIYPFLNNNLKIRPDVFLKAVESAPESARFLRPSELTRSPAFIKRLVKDFPGCYRYLDNVFKNISALALKAIEGDPAQAEFLPDNASIIIEAVQQTPECYPYLSPSWRSMPDLAAIAIQLGSEAH